MTKRKVAQEMSEGRKIALAKQYILRLGLDAEDIMPKLQAKMGGMAYDFVKEACMHPGYLVNRTGEPFQKSKDLIATYANENVSDERIAKALGARTDKEITTKIVSIQAAALRYNAAKESEELKPAELSNLRQEADQKHQQAILRMNQRTDIQPAKITPTYTIPTFTAPEAIAPWQKPAEPTTKAIEPTDGENLMSPEARARQKAQEQLAAMKNGRTGEISLDELNNQGVTPADMQCAVTKENMTEIHAGPQAQALGKKAQQIDAQRHTVGRCAGAAGDSIRITTGYDYHADAEGTVKYRIGRKTKYSTGNGTTQTRAIRKAEEFYAFDFSSDKQNGNPEIAGLKEPGTYIGWEAKADARQPLGHAAIMGPDGKWHCDITQTSEYMSSAQPAKRYQSDTYTIAFLGDCTASDKLAEEMLYQKYLREENQIDLTQFRVADNAR